MPNDDSWLDELWGWVIEFRVMIGALIFIILLLSFHSCEIRVSIDSRPSQGGAETAGPK